MPPPLRGGNLGAQGMRFPGMHKAACEAPPGWWWWSLDSPAVVFQAREGQVALAVRWVVWAAEVVTGAVALPREGPEDPEETLLVEEMSSTEPETGSAPTRKSSDASSLPKTVMSRHLRPALGLPYRKGLGIKQGPLSQHN